MIASNAKFFRSVGRAARGFALALLAASVAAAAPAGERWLKVAAPEFTVITSLREKEAVAWAGEFSQFVAALQSFLNVNPKRLPRLTMVVFARERDFERFRPLRENGTPMEVAGFFSRRPSWAVAGLAGTGLRDETRTTIFHEGTHWFLSGIELPNPVWLEEGLAEVFSTFTIEGKNMSWGRPIEHHILALRALTPPPLERLLFLARDDLHGAGDEGSEQTALAYARSWAFVHYLTFGQREVPKGALIDYVKKLRQTHPDEAFQQAFGGSYADIDKKLGGYVHTGRYYVARQPLATLPALKAQPASAAEVEDALGRLRMAARRHGEAQANVAAVIAAAPDAPRSYELQGELAQEMGDADAAHAAYKKAIEKGATDFRPYYELAAADHAAAGDSSSPTGSLTPEKAREIANGYERAINLNPRHRPAYQGLAGLLGIATGPHTEDARFLELGLRLFPDDGMIRLGLATLAKREGNIERARTLLQEVLANSNHPTRVLTYARRIENSWLEGDVFSRINALAKERKFGEALAVLDKQLEEGVDFATGQRLHKMRNDLHASHLLEQARTALAERRIDEAKAKFNAVLESNVSPILKSQVRRQLEQLEKRAVKKAK